MLGVLRASTFLKVIVTLLALDEIVRISFDGVHGNLLKIDLLDGFSERNKIMKRSINEIF